MYAIVRSGGRQHRVSVGDVLDVDRTHASPGSTVELPVVLVVDDGKVTAEPAKLARYRVTAEVVREVKGPKIEMMTYKSKTGYRRRLGHRQRHTQIKVTGIESGRKRTAKKADDKATEQKSAEKS